MVRQTSHLAAVPLEEPDFAAAHAKAPPVQLLLPKEHAALLVPPVETPVPGNTPQGFRPYYLGWDEL